MASMRDYLWDRVEIFSGPGGDEASDDGGGGGFC